MSQKFLKFRIHRIPKKKTPKLAENQIDVPAVSSKGSPEHQDSPNSDKKTPKRSLKGKKRGNQSTSPKKKNKKNKAGK